MRQAKLSLHHVIEPPGSEHAGKVRIMFEESDSGALSEWVHWDPDEGSVIVGAKISNYLKKAFAGQEPGVMVSLTIVTDTFPP